MTHYIPVHDRNIRLNRVERGSGLGGVLHHVSSATGQDGVYSLPTHIHTAGGEGRQCISDMWCMVCECMVRCECTCMQSAGACISIR